MHFLFRLHHIEAVYHLFFNKILFLAYNPQYIF